jgi:hypothetical protein
MLSPKEQRTIRTAKMEKMMARLTPSSTGRPVRWRDTGVVDETTTTESAMAKRAVLEEVQKLDDVIERITLPCKQPRQSESATIEDTQMETMMKMMKMQQDRMEKHEQQLQATSALIAALLKENKTHEQTEHTEKEQTEHTEKEQTEKEQTEKEHTENENHKIEREPTPTPETPIQFEVESSLNEADELARRFLTAKSGNARSQALAIVPVKNCHSTYKRYKEKLTAITAVIANIKEHEKEFIEQISKATALTGGRCVDTLSALLTAMTNDRRLDSEFGKALFWGLLSDPDVSQKASTALMVLQDCLESQTCDMAAMIRRCARGEIGMQADLQSCTSEYSDTLGMEHLRQWGFSHLLAGTLAALNLGVNSMRLPTSRHSRMSGRRHSSETDL